MAWQAHGACNVTLVDALVRAQLIRSEAVKAAFLQVDRHWFMPERQLSRAYMDAPQPIGYNVTISAPHMHAIMAEIVQETCDSLSGKKILDVGSGSGYLTAVFAAMVGPLGSVVGVEHVKELVALSERRLQTNFPDWPSSRIKFECADGQAGFSQGAPFDVIHVGAAAATVPKALIDQLSPSGCLVIPVGVETQELLLITKSPDGKSTNVFSKGGVRFVPLTELQLQLKS